MLLRRVSKNVKDQNWFAVGLDFMIVVFGVFMGLQVQEWNQQRKDRHEEQTYIARLSSDFAAIDDQIGQCLSVYKNSLDAIDYVSTAIETYAASEQKSEPDRDDFIAALIRLTAGSISPGRSATFVEMLSSGDLNILQDGALRSALVAYDERAQVNREIWRFTQDEASIYQRPLYENIDLSINLENDSYVTIHSYDVKSMASDPDFQIMLNALPGINANNYELCRYQLTLSDNVHDQINRTAKAE